MPENGSLPFQHFDPLDHDPDLGTGNHVGPRTPQHALSYPRTSQVITVTSVPMAGLKSPIVGLALSFVLPGVGSMYAGRPVKGTTILALSALFFVASFVIIGIPFAVALWVYGMYAAASDVARHNDRLINGAHKHHRSITA